MGSPTKKRVSIQTKKAPNKIPFTSDTALLIGAGFLLFFTSFLFDKSVHVFFLKFYNPFLDTVFAVLTHFALVVILMLLLPSILLYKYHQKDKHIIPALWLAFSTALVAGLFLKLLVGRFRPHDMGYLIPVLNYSFPSMHALAAFSVLPIIDKYKFSKIFIAIAVLIAVSRVYFSFHYLSDVIFGMFGGFIIGHFWKNNLDHDATKIRAHRAARHRT